MGIIQHDCVHNYGQDANYPQIYLLNTGFTNNRPVIYNIQKELLRILSCYLYSKQTLGVNLSICLIHMVKYAPT